MGASGGIGMEIHYPIHYVYTLLPAEVHHILAALAVSLKERSRAEKNHFLPTNRPSGSRVIIFFLPVCLDSYSIITTPQTSISLYRNLENYPTKW